MRSMVIHGEIAPIETKKIGKQQNIFSRLNSKDVGIETCFVTILSNLQEDRRPEKETKENNTKILEKYCT